MVTKTEAVKELGRRGELPPEQQAAFDELKRRGEFEQTVKDSSILGTVADVATTVGTGAAGFAAELGGRLAGLPFGTEKSLQFGETARNAIATEPTTKGGEAVIKRMGELVDEFKGLVDLAGAGVAGGAQLISGGGVQGAVDEINKVREQGLSETMRENVFNATGSPAAASLFGAVPETAALVAGGTKTPSKLEVAPKAISPGTKIRPGAKPSGNLPKDVRVSGRSVLPRDRSSNISAKADVDAAAASAFDELGIRPTPELIANDAEFVNLTNSVAEIVGSNLSKEQTRVVQELSTKADELITNIGGKTDRSAIASNVESEFKNTIDKIKAEEDVVWKPIREIPGSTKIRATDDLVSYVDTKLADAKGSRAKLSPMDKEIFDLVYEIVPVRDPIILKSGKVSKKADGTTNTRIRKDENGKVVHKNVRVDTTNALLNRTRSKIGRAGGKQDPIYPDSSARDIGEAYSVLAKEQSSHIPAELADDFKIANTLTVKRKGLEANSKKLFGKNLDKGLVPKIDSAATAIANGNVAPLRNLLREAPQASRAEIAATVLDSLIKSPGREIKGTFVERFNGIRANKEAMNELFRNFPPETRKGI